MAKSSIADSTRAVFCSWESSFGTHCAQAPQIQEIAKNGVDPSVDNARLCADLLRLFCASKSWITLMLTLLHLLEGLPLRVASCSVVFVPYFMSFRILCTVESDGLSSGQAVVNSLWISAAWQLLRIIVTIKNRYRSRVHSISFFRLKRSDLNCSPRSD